MTQYVLATILITLLPLNLWAQYDYKETIEKTDSSIITTLYEERQGQKTIKVYNDLKKSPLTYYSELYYDTKKVKTEGLFYPDYDTRIGNWNYYSEEGVLQRTDNYSNGYSRNYVKNDSITDLFNSTLKIADSFLIAYFGKEFFKHHIQFNANESDCERACDNWFENRRKKKPGYFYFMYNIVLDNEHGYSTIEFFLDSAGFKNITGIPDCINNCKFNLTYQSALKIAKDNGLKLKKDKYFADLKWSHPLEDSVNIKRNDNKVYRGKYEYRVASFRRKKNVKGDGIVRTIAFYDVVYIDPWTGNFLRRGEISRVISWQHLTSRL